MTFSRLSSFLPRSSQTVWDLEKRAIQKGRDLGPYIREKAQKRKYKHLPKAQQDVWALHDRAVSDGYSSKEYYINKVVESPELYGYIPQKHLDDYRRIQAEKEALEAGNTVPIVHTEFYRESLLKAQAANDVTAVGRSDSLQVHPSSTKRLSQEKRPRLMLPRFPKRVSEGKVERSFPDGELSISKPASVDLDENAFRKECSIAEPPPSQHPSEAIPSSLKAGSVKQKSQESLLLSPQSNKNRPISKVGPLPGAEAFTSSGLQHRDTDESSVLTKKSGSSWFRRSRNNNPYPSSSANTSNSTSKTTLLTTLSQLSIGKKQKTSSSLGLADNDLNFASPFVQPRDKEGNTAGFTGTEVAKHKPTTPQILPKNSIMKTVEIETRVETL